jgi:hypothetical protein
MPQPTGTDVAAISVGRRAPVSNTQRTTSGSLVLLRQTPENASNDHHVRIIGMVDADSVRRLP